MNIQGWFPLGLTGLISFPSKGLSRDFPSTTVHKYQFFSTHSHSQHSHPYMTTGKTIGLTIGTLSTVMSMLLNLWSRFVITFLPRSKHLLIPWLQSLSAVILEPRKENVSLLPMFPLLFAWNDGPGCHDLSFLNADFKPTFSLSSSTLIKRLLSSSSLYAIRVVSSA